MCIYPRAKGLGAIFVAIFVPPAAGTGTDVATDTGSLPRAPQEPPRGRPGRQREAKNEKPTKISLFVFFSFYFFFFRLPPAAAINERHRRGGSGGEGNGAGHRPPPQAPPAVGGSPPRCAPLPAPPRLRGRGARPAAGSRLPPAAPRGSAGASSPFWVPGAVPRGKPALEKESPTRKQPLPMSPSRGTPRAKARGFVPLPSRGAWPGWDNSCGENGFKNAPSQEKITFLALNVRGLV